MAITVSLKDALHARPDAPKGTPGQNGMDVLYQGTDGNWNKKRWTSLADYAAANHDLGGLTPSTGWTDDGRPIRSQTVRVTPMWTAQEYRAFDRLQAMSCSHLQSDRTRGRQWLKNFIDKHGKEKCDMMLAEIRRRAEQEWFKDSNKRKGA